MHWEKAGSNARWRAASTSQKLFGREQKTKTHVSPLHNTCGDVAGHAEVLGIHRIAHLFVGTFAAISVGQMLDGCLMGQQLLVREIGHNCSHPKSPRRVYEHDAVCRHFSGRPGANLHAGQAVSKSGRAP